MTFMSGSIFICACMTMLFINIKTSLSFVERPLYDNVNKNLFLMLITLELVDGVWCWYVNN
jgi:hypothetical protein